MSKISILYLYAEIMGYQIPVLQEYVKTFDAHVHVVHWDTNKLTPYIPPEIENVTYYPRSQRSVAKLLELADYVKPDIVYISGWQDRGYLAVVKQLRKSGVPVVTGFDDQWLGTLRQHAAALLFPIIRRQYYSHCWVAGPCQYEYARRLGFRKDEIIHNLLSCNTSLFRKGVEFLRAKKLSYPKRFLYVGNFRHIKGTDILVEAFKIYKNTYNGTWDMVCVGNGDMKYLLQDVPGLSVFDFMRQEELVNISKDAGAFILPSRLDQWGVVVHEFACAGLPLILSENVGASPVFLVENYNGFSFKNNSPKDLAYMMKTLADQTDSKLLEMANNSAQLSTRISPSIAAASYLSILQRERNSK